MAKTRGDTREFLSVLWTERGEQHPNVACPGSKTTEYFKYYICERISMISKNVTSELKLDTQRGEI